MFSYSFWIRRLARTTNVNIVVRYGLTGYDEETMETFYGGREVTDERKSQEILLVCNGRYERKSCVWKMRKSCWLFWPWKKI